MDNFELFNNLAEPVCIISADGKIVYKNTQFINTFPEFGTMEKFKKRFDFELYFFDAVNFEHQTPIDLMLASKENFHTVCTYRGENDDYRQYYIYSFNFEGLKTAVFKDITDTDRVFSAEKRYKKLKTSYEEIKKEAAKLEKLKEQAQAQVLKMGIISRISLVIRETNNIETIISAALNEIHNLTGAFKTYFSFKEKNGFKVCYSVPEGFDAAGMAIEYDFETVKSIQNKDITASYVLKEYLNSSGVLSKGVKRIIIPVYDRNRLLGVIASFTKQRFNEKDNTEILQSIAVQLSSAVVQADLIQKLDKKNKKLYKTLAELKDTQMQLINTEKTASIGQLAAGIAHEINTPLAAVSSNSEMISRIINSMETPEKDKLKILRELNELDMEASKRISEIVKSLKRYIRLDEAELQTADINSEIDLTLKLASSEIKKNTKIIKKYGKIPNVKCRINMINQVFMNLIVNAGQSIDSEKAEGVIEIETSADDKNLTVKIRDNGCGISKENRNKIFSGGFTTKKAGIGTGLGLSISKKIIEMHKGSISFSSKENEGSEFTIILPCEKK